MWLKEKLKENKEKIFDCYLNWRNRTGKGYNLLHMPLQVYKIVGYGLIIIGLFYKTKNSNQLLFWSFIAGILILISLYYIGDFMDRTHFIHAETEWNNKRNPFVNELRNAKFEIKFDTTANKYIATFIKKDSL